MTSRVMRSWLNRPPSRNFSDTWESGPCPRSWRRAATAPTGLICSTVLRERSDFSATASNSVRNTCITPMLCAKRVWVALGYTADASPSCCSDLRRWKWAVLISSSTTGYSDTSIKLCTGSITRTAFSFLSLFGTQPSSYRSISSAVRLLTRGASGPA